MNSFNDFHSSPLRFTDFEGLYNKAQKALENNDEIQREKDLILAKSKEKSIRQEGELETLR